MKKKLLITVLTAVLAGSLTACSGQRTGTVSGPSSESVSGTEQTTADNSPSSQAETEKPEAQSGHGLGSIEKVTAIAHVNKVYHQIGTVIVEYSQDIVAPGTDGFTVEDFAVANFKEEYDQRPSSKAPITAIYTNNAPETREDRLSVEGKYLVIELEPTTHCVEEDGMYKPNHNAGMCTWRLAGESCEWQRDDFSQFVVTQNVDILDKEGNVVAEAAVLPSLEPEDIVTPELATFENLIIENFDGNNNSIYYTLHLPENYDPSRKYPLVFNSPGNGGRLNYDQQNDAGEFVNAGAVVTRDRVAVTVAEQEEAIIASIQTWRNAPEEWKYDDVAAALYLVEYMKDNYSVDEKRVYAVGSSYGTMLVSRMLNVSPGLFTAYLQYNGCWSIENVDPENGWLSVYALNDPEARNGMQIFDGYTFDTALEVMNENRLSDISHAKELLKPIADSKMPVWVWHAVNDETISFMHGVATYETLEELYQEQGLTPTEISQLVDLRVVEDEEYWKAGIAERHACSKLAATYPEALQWLFRQSK